MGGPGTPLMFYATAVHPCGYLPGREAVNLVADPAAPMSTAVYSVLIDEGFRRSGEHVYRPHCPTCDACVPARIPVVEFAPRRSQRRAWRRNADLRVEGVLPRHRHEYFELYRRYLASRHPGGGMDEPDPEQYLYFLTSPWSDTVFYEFRAGDRLVGIAVTDLLTQGLSAVYTFFDPDEEARSLGVFAVLWQIEAARRLGLPYLYLGYWIRESPKMAYKADYRPLEILRGGRWLRCGRQADPHGDPAR